MELLTGSLEPVLSEVGRFVSDTRISARNTWSFLAVKQIDR